MFACMDPGPASFIVALSVLAAGPAHAQFVESDVQVLHTWFGAAAGDTFGFVTDPVGDLDGDGVSDLAVTAPWFDAPGFANAGRVSLFSGRTGALIDTIEGLFAGEFLGASVSGPGDLTGDNVPDMLVGSFGDPFGSANTASRVRLYSGVDRSIVWTFNGLAPGDRAGFASGGVLDDVNGDGVNDVLIGANGADIPASLAGAVHVVSGANGTLIRTHTGTGGVQAMGVGVASLADLDADGVRDYAIAAQRGGTTGWGYVQVRSGASGGLLRTLNAEVSARSYGVYFLEGCGDVDADGFEDLYVPDFSDNEGGSNAGKATVYSGATGAVLFEWKGRAPNEGFGIGRGMGDVNGDGHADLFLAGYTSSAGALGAGQGLVYSGNSGRVLRTITCDIPGDQLGYDATGIPDVNADGIPDLMISAPGNDTNGDFSGVVYVIAGTIGSCVADWNGSGGAPDSSDFLAFLNSWAGHDPRADLNPPGGNGSWDSSDFLVFLNEFSIGC